MPTALAHTLAFATLLLALAVARASEPSLPLEALRAAVGAGLWALAATGLGGALLGQARLAAAFSLGMGVLGLALLPLAALGGLTPAVLGGVVVLASAGWLARPRIEWPAWPAGAGGWALAFGLPALLVALGPAIDTDEVYQHLALPARMLRAEGLVGGLLAPDGSRPLPLHLLYTGAMALGGAGAPKLLHLGWTLLLLLQVLDMGTRLLGRRAGGLAALLLLGSYTFIREAGLAHNNIPVALWGLMALEAALEGRGRRMAIFAGMALAGKYTAAPLVAGVFLVHWGRRAHGAGWLPRVPELAGLTALALAWVLPWWLRNLAEGLHPLFPYAGWPGPQDLTFAYAERYGMGRDLGAMLALPWNLTVHAETTSYVFLGQVSPAALLCLPGLALATLRGDSLVHPLLGVGLVAFVGWALGPHWLRYLLPAAPVLALLAGAGFNALPTWGRWVIKIGWVAGLPANLGPWLVDVAAFAPVVVGGRSAEALLEERLPGYTAARWVNEHAPAEARVAVLFAWPLAWIDRDLVLGSVEDHVPARHLLLTRGDESLRWLKAQGVTHVLAGRVNFIPKSYPFLEPEVFTAQLVEPERRLERLLLAEGTLVFEDGRVSVWRLLP